MFYPPGPAQKLPLFLFLNFLRNPIEVLIEMSKYGDISHFKFGGGNMSIFLTIQTTLEMY